MPGPSPPVRVALIGYGLAGRVFHAPLIEAEPALDLVTVVTTDPGRAARARTDLPDATVVSDPGSLWHGPARHDLVVVATANVAHERLTRTALEHGLHVVVDKPMARDASGAASLAETARQQRRQLHVFHNRRWDSDFRTVQALADSGSLGRVRRLESRFERWRPGTTGEWRESAAADQMGGLLYDLGPHLVDQALLLLGPASTVYAEVTSVRDPAAADDDVFVALTHDGAAVSHLWASAVAAHRAPRFRVLGSQAAYVVDGLDSQEDRLRAGERPGAGWGVEDHARWGRLLPSGELVPTLTGAWPQYYRAVAASLTGQGAAPVALDDVVAVHRVLDAARESARTQAVVRLS